MEFGAKKKLHLKLSKYHIKMPTCLLLLGIFCYRLPWWLSAKEPACQFRRHGFDPWIRKIPLEKERATYSSILVWEMPWTEEPGGLSSWGHRRVRHDLATKQQSFATYVLSFN